MTDKTDSYTEDDLIQLSAQANNYLLKAVEEV